MTRVFIFVLISLSACNPAIKAQENVTAIAESSAFSIASDGSSSLGAATLQSGADMRFGSTAPGYTIGEGHDTLLGRSLGQDEAKLRIALKSPDSLTASQLAGTWKLYEYRIDEAIGFSFSTTVSTFTAASGTFSIDANRNATTTLDGETATFAVNASKDLMVSTSSEANIISLRILVRPESGGSTSQMAGTWTVGSFGVDLGQTPPDRWYDGDTLTASTSGVLSISGESAAWSANGSGSITISDSEGSTALSVNQSRSALAYVAAPGPDQGHDGAILLRHAAAPSIVSLAGDWTLHTFELIDAPDVNIVETYHSDGTTLASRTRYTNGQLHGTPAFEQWNEDGRQTQKDDYTNDVLTYSQQTSYDGEILRTANEYFYEDGTLISSDEQLYHTDGVTVGSRVLSTLTEEGLQVIEDTFKANGKQTHQSIYLNGTLRTKIDWNYHPNGNVSTKGFNDYTTGVHLLKIDEWYENGTRAGVTRYHNSKRHGIQEGYDSSGNLVREETYQHGTKHGRERRWYDGGSQLESEATFQDGKLHGLSSSWYANGRLRITQEYNEGLRHGEQYTYIYFESGSVNKKEYSVWEYGEQRRLETWFWNASGLPSSYNLAESESQDLQSPDANTGIISISKVYDDQGRPTWYKEWRDGKDHGLNRHWTEGILDEEDINKEGQLHGRSRRFNSVSGNIEVDAYYENGLLHGPFKYYNDGVLEEEGNHVLGLREGLVTSYNDLGTTTATYRNDILHGPYSSPSSSGSYINGFEHGTWSYFSNGQLTQTIEYSNGTIHGTVEHFTNGELSSRERYTDGLLDGLQESFANGRLDHETAYNLGVEIGPRISYHENGRESSIVNVNAGLAHGSAKTFDDRGRTTNSGSYNHGVQTGTWTSTSYDSEGNADSDTNNYGSPDPTENRRGIKGRVTSGGIGLPNVSLRLGLGSPSTQTNPDGTFLLEIGDYVGSTELTIIHPNFKDKTESITLPDDYTYPTRNFTLDEHTNPPFELGEPDMPGTYFLEGVSFPTYFSDLQIPGIAEGEEEQNSSKLIWLKPDQPAPGEFPYPQNSPFFVDPGRDVASDGNAGKIFLRSAPGVESNQISLPTYNIAQNPAWADTLGGWGTVWDGDPNNPGEYRLNYRWPPDGPIDFGIKRESVSSEAWALWQIVPIIGGEDFGLFNTFVDIDAFASTDGTTGDVEFEANGDLRFGLSLPALPVGLALKSRLNAEGSGTLNWRDTLSLDSASIKLSKASEGKIIFKPTTLFEKYGIDFEWLKPLGTFGLQFTELINVIEFEVSYGESFEGDISLYAGKDSLEILTASAEKRASLAAELDSYLKELEIGIKGEAFVNVTYTDSLASSLAFGSTIEVNGRVVVDDIALFSFTIPEEPEPSSTLGSQSIKPQFVPASYSGMNDYARFDPKDRIEILSSNATTTAEPDELPLVSNVYPHAEPTVAEFGGTKAIAYIHFDPTRPEGQSTRLYYSIDSGNGFGTPKAVHDQARSDFDPQIAYLPDGRLLALWKTSHLDQISPTLNERLAGSEIAWSIYDSSSDIWSEPTLITNNAHIDHRPSIASSAGGLMAVWHSNEANAYFPDYDYPDTVNFARWSESAFDNPSTLPFELPTMGSVSAAYDGSNASLAWIQDIDGDFATTEDIELFRAKFDGDSWSDPERLTNDSLIDARPALLCSNEGAFETVWLKNGRLVRLASEESLTYENVFASIQADGSTNYSVSCTDDGNIALVWSEYVGTQNDLLFSYFDSLSAQWSEPVQLTDNFELERASAFTLDNNGKLLAAYLSEHTDSEQRDLRWLECEIGRDLTIESVTIAPIEDSPGQFNISASVANLGALPSGSTKVDFHNGDPNNGGIYLGELVVNLKGGENTDVLYQTGVLAEGTIYARIDPDNTVEELDESNNTASSSLNPVDLEANYLTWDRSVSDESTLTLKGTIANNGRTAQTNIPVTIRDASGPLFTTTVTSLEPGESTSVEATLAAPSENKYRYTLEVDPDNTLNEPDRSDNAFPLIVTLARLKDSDGDGMENAWEELNFGTLERDGSGDFDGDGLTDAFEFITQNDPLDPRSKFPFTIEPHPTDDSKVLIKFPSHQGRVYRIQRSSDLSNWTNDSIHRGTGEVISVVTDATNSANGLRLQIGQE